MKVAIIASLVIEVIILHRRCGRDTQRMVRAPSPKNWRFQNPTTLPCRSDRTVSLTLPFECKKPHPPSPCLKTLTSLKFKIVCQPYLDDKGWDRTVCCIAQEPPLAPMNERASHYSGCSAISHVFKELRRAGGQAEPKTTRHVCAGQITTLHLCSVQMERTSRRSYAGARNSPRSQPAVVRDFIGSTSSTTR
jgi:hypothetical protein